MNYGGMGGGIEDIIGQMFGGGSTGGMGGMPRQPPRQPPRQQPKAAPINVGLDVTMAQAEEGGEFTFSYKRFKRQGTSMETKLSLIHI